MSQGSKMSQIKKENCVIITDYLISLDKKKHIKCQKIDKRAGMTHLFAE